MVLRLGSTVDALIGPGLCLGAYLRLSATPPRVKSIYQISAKFIRVGKVLPSRLPLSSKYYSTYPFLLSRRFSFRLPVMAVDEGEGFFYDGDDNVENLRMYKPGGYHPVHLGDVLPKMSASRKPRYRVMQKLGHGAFSTVWLARDLHGDL